MTLYELAYACHLYTRDFGHYDLSYADFTKATAYAPDLSDSDHRTALLEWLRSWGCRQFALEWSEYSSAQILNWYEGNRDALFPSNKYLWELTRRDLEPVGKAYHNLSLRGASFRQNGEEQIHVRVGQTGAAKILFAIRPNALAPSDGKIRSELTESKPHLTTRYLPPEEVLNSLLTRSYAEYVDYIVSLKAQLQEIGPECREHGFGLIDLPRQLRRIHGSVPKLIDDYHWITITKNNNMLEPASLERWVRREFPDWFH